MSGETPVAAGLTWVGWDEGPVEPENRHVRVEEDRFLTAGARVEEFEEWRKQWVAEVVALVVGQEDRTNGP